MVSYSSGRLILYYLWIANVDEFVCDTFPLSFPFTYLSHFASTDNENYLIVLVAKIIKHWLVCMKRSYPLDFDFSPFFSQIFVIFVTKVSMYISA